jgi:DNA-directed RNA polymerase specialized sigma24 family protein
MSIRPASARRSSFTAWGYAIARYQILSVRKRHSTRGVLFSQAAAELLQSESDRFLEQTDVRMQALRQCLDKLGIE